MSLIESYRTPDDRAAMARHWCERHYNGDTSPESMERIKADLDSLTYVDLAYLYREAVAASPASRQMPDNFDPWR